MGRYTNIENCKIYARNCRYKFSNDQDFTFAGFLKEREDLVLICRLAHIDKNIGHYEFAGYWCRKAYQRKGYMSEAVKAVMQFAHDQMGGVQFKITHAAGNDKTRYVMEKCGFKETHIRDQAHILPDGRVVDEHVLEFQYTNDI